MSGFLVDTLVWTGALIALVLLVRRPVNGLFGARATYALWALPLLRLLLPPLLLPAWMAPTGPVAPPMMSGGAGVTAPPAASAPELASALPQIAWSSLLLGVWLAGAAIFLLRRFALYFRMRRELLAQARPVGRAGRVRLVETPAADGPVAFGVIDKVVALPPGFMAGHDRTARDLALAHELAHHRGHDLALNMAAQPLFALHWFNPLSVLGWRAMRRDQEAACDARVIAHEPALRRAAYAEVIARFAIRSPGAAHLALAAPMACPVLGDRSLVHRLRSLAMTPVSPRRRWTGRLLLAGAACALPLTATIGYARGEPSAPPEPPAPVAAPAAVAPPAPPTPSAPPATPAPPSKPEPANGERRILRIERTVEKDGNGERRERVERRVILDGEAMSAEERAQLHRDMAELRRSMAVDGEVQREIRIAIAEARTAAPQVTVECRDGQREISETVTDKDGRTRMFICTGIAMAEAHRALATARAEIARTRELAAKQRAEALRSLDEAERTVRAR